jgi:hypothetical protein
MIRAVTGTICATAAMALVVAGPPQPGPDRLLLAGGSRTVDPVSTSVDTGVPRVDAAATRPVRLRIPALDVAAPIMAVQVRNGVLAIPADIATVGWDRASARPGSTRGTVLLVGHRDSATGGQGALSGLERVPVGARVVLATAEGRRVAYRVTRVDIVAKDALPSRLYSQVAPPRLAIVTCGGTLRQAADGWHWDSNVIAWAVPVSPGIRR